jgi:GH15 family glucan-1,4-alpha-glucosidase
MFPDHEILRIAVCERGSVEIEQRFAPRPGYGRRARIADRGKLGLAVDTGRGVAILRSDVPLQIGDGEARGRITLKGGERAISSLSFAHDGPATLAPLGFLSERALGRSVAWWQRWSARARYDGPFREAVVRSALAIKLLVYAPSGAVMAAATTSLPERPHGDLNWDYRFCWLRDASLTVRALCALGYDEEAETFVSWLLHSTRLTRPALRILYDVYGNEPPREHTLDRWRGYGGARPVRIGNAAVEQLQLDVYGEVVDATAQLLRDHGRIDTATQRMLLAFGKYVLRHWRAPDEGIWEPRSGRAEHTHSRLLCWTAVDRLIELHERGLLRRAPVDELRATRDAIRHEILTRAWNDRIGSYVATLDGDDVDATLLLLPWYGFEPADSPRMRGTWRRIEERLGAGDALLYRYRSGDSPGEGAFGISSFWAAEYLALAGRADEAEARIAAVSRYANDVGLLAEEIEPRTGAALGNFPQAFSHVGLINAAVSLERQRAEERATPAQTETAR